MASVSASLELPGRIFEAETCWYDLERWPEWVDGLAEVVEVQGDWPRPGSTVVWVSGPAGRGTVRERVTEYEPRSGQASEVEDNSITGVQRVAFAPRGHGAELRLSLDYRLKRRSPLSALVDLLFIRRLMAASLARTLAQFSALLCDSPPTGFK
jgi:hypothetical protein